MLRSSTVPSHQNRTLNLQPYNQLRSLMPRLQQPLVIGVAGNLMAGKAAYVQLLSRILGPELVSSFDLSHYYLKHPTAQPSLEVLDPKCYDLDRAAADLQTLKQGNSLTLKNELDGRETVIKPTPIIGVQGLHSLYPQLLPHIDFGIFLCKSYELAWNYSFDRYVTQGGLEVADFEDHMVAQDKAYKDWIEPQQKDAHLLEIASPSSLKDFAAPHLLDGSTLPQCPKIQLVLDPITTTSPSLSCLLDLGQMLTLNHHPMMVAVVPSVFWGKKVVRIHIDGFFSQESIEVLIQQIHSFSATPTTATHLLNEILGITTPVPAGPEDSLGEEEEQPDMLSAPNLSQLIVIWRVLEEIKSLVLSRLEAGTLKLHSGPFAGLAV